MKNNIEYLLWALGLLFCQVLLFNNLSIGGAVNIFIYVYFIIALPTNINRTLLLFMGFILGATIDVFSNTWGIHTLATTFIAYIRPYFISLIFSQDDKERLVPRMKILGFTFWKYAVAMVFFHHLLLFSLEAFSFSFFFIVLLKTVVSTLITLLLVFAIEKLRK